HGTTVATNAVLEGKYAPTALVTSAGFRDVLALARQRRPDLWDIDVPKPDTIVRPDASFEIPERIDAKGDPIRVPTDTEIEEVTRQIAGVDSVAVCFLHSYANSSHEARVVEAIRQRLPGVYVCSA